MNAAASDADRRIQQARIVAMAMDALQLLSMITVGWGFWFAPVSLLAGAAIVYLIGWRWLLLPAFVLEVLPFFDLGPWWTLIVWTSTRRRPA